jgi:hypothetical protein
VHGTRAEGVNVHGTILKGVKDAWYQSEWYACA